MTKLLALGAVVLLAAMASNTNAQNLRSKAEALWKDGKELVVPEEPALPSPAPQPPRTAPSPQPQPTAPAPQPQPAAKTPSPKAAAMNEAGFWQLIEETRAAAGNDTSRQSELLKERLTQLPATSIVQFDRIRLGLDARAYSWDLWGAAYVIEDGCSDDCFRDFRGYLISLGRAPYEAALRDPDSLAAVAQDAETGNWENADNVAPDAYSSVTGGDFPRNDSDLSGNPRGTPFDENNPSALAPRYPRLFARFR
jgi:hypothetical protein